MRAWSELSVAFCQKQKEDSSSLRGEKLFFLLYLFTERITLFPQNKIGLKIIGQKKDTNKHTHENKEVKGEKGKADNDGWILFVYLSASVWMITVSLKKSQTLS